MLYGLCDEVKASISSRNWVALRGEAAGQPAWTGRSSAGHTAYHNFQHAAAGGFELKHPLSETGALVPACFLHRRRNKSNEKETNVFNYVKEAEGRS